MVVAVFSESTVSASLTLGSVPLARVGPSLTTHNDKLYVFGGRTISPVKVTNELYCFDLNTMAWEQITFDDETIIPKPRYFHSATIYDDKYLVISGGQGEPKANEAPNVLNDICFFNLITHEWEIFELSTTTFPSRYAHLTIYSGASLFIIGGQDGENHYLNDIYTFDLRTKELEQKCTISSGVGSYRSTLSLDPQTKTMYIFSNTRFNNPIREVLSFDEEMNMNSFQFPQNRPDLPPALRFPEGYIIGDELVISGTYISNNIQSYSLWSLNLIELVWKRIDTGSCFARGSWNRGVLHPQSNQFIIFGHRDREIVNDYNQRRINFNHISIVNLEAFNIYRKPVQCEDDNAVDLGLLMMYEPRYSNFALITKDGFRIHINSGFLRARWSTFDTYLTNSQDKDQSLTIFSPNTLLLQESYSVIQVFVRYLYTNTLEFEQARDLNLLGRLLVFAKHYSVYNLYNLVAAQLHEMLTIDNSLETFRIASQAKRDGLKLRTLSLMIKEKQSLLENANFWEDYPENLRNEILKFMPPNFRNPNKSEKLITIPPSNPLPTTTSSQPTSRATSRRPSVVPRSGRDSIGSQLSPPSSPGAVSPPETASPSPYATVNGVTSLNGIPTNGLKDGSIKERPSSTQSNPSTSTLPKKKNSGTSFLKFGTRRPSLANLFNFSSAASSTLLPPNGSGNVGTSSGASSSTSSPLGNPVSKQGDPKDDAKLIRSLYELGLS